METLPLNMFGKNIELTLLSFNLEIGDLADLHPICEDDIKKNFYAGTIPSKEFVSLINGIIEKEGLKQQEQRKKGKHCPVAASHMQIEKSA